jgi:hypothetical protein
MRKAENNYSVIFLIASAMMLISLATFFSCATLKPEEFERAGIKGSVVPVDSDGNEIVMEDKEKIIINCIPLKEDEQQPDMTVTGNARSDGSFQIDLRGGEYDVEIFLEGFYVVSFRIVIDRNRMKNLDEIRLTRIESGTGKPLKDDVDDEVILNEGDVNIQPPS